jgi:hypothetical protein
LSAGSAPALPWRVDVFSLIAGQVGSALCIDTISPLGCAVLGVALPPVPLFGSRFLAIPLLVRCTGCGSCFGIRPAISLLVLLRAEFRADPAFAVVVDDPPPSNADSAIACEEAGMTR